MLGVSSDVCKVNNTDAGGCWCLFVFISKVLCLNLLQSTIIFQMDIVLLFWIFFMIFPNDAQF